MGLLVLALLEASARVAAAALDKDRAHDFDPRLGWRMLPNVEKRGETWSATGLGRTNSRGWRDAERAEPKPAGVVRIAALGDSFTFGQGVDVDDRFTERIAAATGAEVLNFGVCAYGTDQELLVYEVEARAFDPDVVLLTVFLGNDLDDIRLDRQSGWSKPYFLLRPGVPQGGDALELVPPAYSLGTALRTRSYLGELAFQLLERGTPSRRRAPEWETGDTLPLFAALVRRLRDRVDAEGGRLLVLLAQPCDDDGRAVRHARTGDVLGVLADLEIPAVDTWDALTAIGAAAYLSNLHWSPAGHAAAAEVAVAKLRDLALLPR